MSKRKKSIAIVPPKNHHRIGMLRLVHGGPRNGAFGVVPHIAPCSACRRSLPVDLPFAWGLWKGLSADTCPCGNTDVPFSLSADSW